MIDEYHLLNEYNFTKVPKRESRALCGVIIGKHRLYYSVRYMDHPQYKRNRKCPACLAHPNLDLYILEATEL